MRKKLFEKEHVDHVKNMIKNLGELIDFDDYYLTLIKLDDNDDTPVLMSSCKSISDRDFIFFMENLIAAYKEKIKEKDLSNN